MVGTPDARLKVSAAIVDACELGRGIGAGGRSRAMADTIDRMKHPSLRGSWLWGLPGVLLAAAAGVVLAVGILLAALLTVGFADDSGEAERIALVEVGVAGAALGLAGLAVVGVAYEFRRRGARLALEVVGDHGNRVLDVGISNTGEADAVRVWLVVSSYSGFVEPGQALEGAQEWRFDSNENMVGGGIWNLSHPLRPGETTWLSLVVPIEHEIRVLTGCGNLRGPLPEWSGELRPGDLEDEYALDD